MLDSAQSLLSQECHAYVNSKQTYTPVELRSHMLAFSAMPRSQCRGAYVAFCSILLTTVCALEFDMIYQTKCLMEEIGEGIIVLGDYTGERKSDGNMVPLDVQVRSDQGFRGWPVDFKARTSNA